MSLMIISLPLTWLNVQWLSPVIQNNLFCSEFRSWKLYSLSLESSLRLIKNTSVFVENCSIPHHLYSKQIRHNSRCISAVHSPRLLHVCESFACEFTLWSNLFTSVLWRVHVVWHAGVIIPHSYFLCARKTAPIIVYCRFARVSPGCAPLKNRRNVIGSNCQSIIHRENMLLPVWNKMDGGVAKLIKKSPW